RTGPPGILNPTDVVGIDVTRLVERRHGATEALLDELKDAAVGGLARVVAHDEEGGALDAEARAEHQARALRIVLPGPHHLVDALPQAARLQVLRHLSALPAVRAVGELLLHHDHVHRSPL